MDWFDWDAYIKNMQPPKPEDPRSAPLAKANKTGFRAKPKTPHGKAAE